MSEAANAPFGTPNRDVNFVEKAHNFEVTSNRLADTARQVATAGGCNNKNIVEGIQLRAQAVSIYTLLATNLTVKIINYRGFI